jgi:hypothetical protein
MSGTHLDDLAGEDGSEDGEEIGYQWSKVHKSVAIRNENHNRDRELADILLNGEIAIDRQKYVEFALCNGEEIPVLATSPSHRRNRPDLVPDKVPIWLVREPERPVLD